MGDFDDDMLVGQLIHLLNSDFSGAASSAATSELLRTEQSAARHSAHVRTGKGGDEYDGDEHDDGDYDADEYRYEFQYESANHGSEGQGYSEEKFFLDEAGEPTDAFLQALKAGDDALLLHSAAAMSEGSVPSFSKDMHHFVDKMVASTHSQRHVSFGANNRSSSLLLQADREDGEERRCQNSRSGAVEQKRFVKKRDKESQQKPHRSKVIKPHKTKSSSRSSAHEEEAYMFPAAAGILTSPLHVSSATAAAVGAEEELSMQRAIKSLELRVQGQLNSIRRLEQQLKETQLLVDARNKQLAVLSSKLKSLQRQQQQQQEQRVDVCAPESSHNSKKMTATAAAKAAAAAEEMEKRWRRAEERCRSLKALAEKLKAKCGDVEAENKLIADSARDSDTRLQRSRKANKELVAECGALRSTLIDKESEVAAMSRQLQKAEAGARNLQMALEHSRAELRNQRHETFLLQKQQQQSQLQAQIQKEKLSTRRARDHLSATDATAAAAAATNNITPDATAVDAPMRRLAPSRFLDLAASDTFGFNSSSHSGSLQERVSSLRRSAERRLDAEVEEAATIRSAPTTTTSAANLTTSENDSKSSSTSINSGDFVGSRTSTSSSGINRYIQQGYDELKIQKRAGTAWAQPLPGAAADRTVADSQQQQYRSGMSSRSPSPIVALIRQKANGMFSRAGELAAPSPGAISSAADPSATVTAVAATRRRQATEGISLPNSGTVQRRAQSPDRSSFTVAAAAHSIDSTNRSSGRTHSGGGNDRLQQLYQKLSAASSYTTPISHNI